MFEIDYPSHKYRKQAFKWLKIVTIICIINSIMLLFVDAKLFYLFAFLFPLTVTLINNILFGLLVFFKIKDHYKVDNGKYIRNKYPTIWKKLHPFGKYSYNFFTYWKFIKGRYDQGKDKRLNAIKQDENEKLNFSIWTNILSPAVWLLNFFFIYLK